MIYARSVELAKNVAYPLKHPSSQVARSHPGKAGSYAPKAPNEIMLPMRRKKSLTISHTQHRTPQFPPCFNQREKTETRMRPIPGAKKAKKKGKKTRGKLKESK